MCSKIKLPFFYVITNRAVCILKLHLHSYTNLGVVNIYDFLSHLSFKLKNKYVCRNASNRPFVKIERVIAH